MGGLGVPNSALLDSWDLWGQRAQILTRAAGGRCTAAGSGTMSLADAGGAEPHRRVSLWRPVAQLPPHHQPPSTVVQGLAPSQAMQGEGGPQVTQRGWGGPWRQHVWGCGGSEGGLGSGRAGVWVAGRVEGRGPAETRADPGPTLVNAQLWLP